ncbi:hypothetical protein L207DRAFT_441396 [Hyaloscypha variabilis F]|uniref:Geranylgeranyl pyrophosphate synthetase n=1 Tax=Hyaloscypha variabilis (strain UAMH 11265 / GT02V1 / F) TaxID=1149755 RepID=A0A2J6QZJ4_HYAVF|nr:hypothetical protein L207DRAFT_441396 [Hyaloscypha variabilis F]
MTSVDIKDFTFIASYNWCNSDEPAIFVPGCPAKLTLPKLPYQVAKDNGQAFIDQNAHRSPSASFDPFFKALLTMHPNFDMKPIELTTDRNSLRKLLQFVSGKTTKSWRMDVDIIEDTMFFTRWEPHQVQIITGARDSGYGHEFEKAFLSFASDLKESSGHHRIVRYNLGGIECLVRFGVDGYLGDDVSVDNKTSTVKELEQALADLNIQDSNKVSATATATAAEVKVIEKGRLVDDSTTLELKSRSLNMSLKMAEYIPQLWISQTRNLFVGRHKNGLVKEQVKKFDMSEYFPTWENKNQDYGVFLGGKWSKCQNGESTSARRPKALGLL